MHTVILHKNIFEIVVVGLSCCFNLSRCVGHVHLRCSPGAITVAEVQVDLKGQFIKLLCSNKVACIHVLLPVQAARVGQVWWGSFYCVLEFIVKVLLGVILVMLIHHQGAVVYGPIGVFVIQFIRVDGTNVCACVLN